MPPNLGTSIPTFDQHSNLRAEIPAFENAFKFEGVDSTRHFQGAQTCGAWRGSGKLGDRRGFRAVYLLDKDFVRDIGNPDSGLGLLRR